MAPGDLARSRSTASGRASSRTRCASSASAGGRGSRASRRNVGISRTACAIKRDRGSPHTASGPRMVAALAWSSVTRVLLPAAAGPITSRTGARARCGWRTGAGATTLEAAPDLGLQVTQDLRKRAPGVDHVGTHLRPIGLPHGLRPAPDVVGWFLRLATNCALGVELEHDGNVGRRPALVVRCLPPPQLACHPVVHGRAEPLGTARSGQKVVIRDRIVFWVVYAVRRCEG